MKPQTIEELKWEFEKISEDLSAFRKKGEDVFITGLKAMQVPGKIKMAEATKDEKDIDRLRMLIKEIQNEIGQIAVEGSLYKLLVDQRIVQMQEAFSKKDMPMVHLFYEQVKAYYGKLNPDEKLEARRMLAPIFEKAGKKDPGKLFKEA